MEVFYMNELLMVYQIYIAMLVVAVGMVTYGVSRLLYVLIMVL